MVAVLQEAGQALTSAQLKSALRERGVAPQRLSVWPRVRPRLAAHEQVRVGGDRHRRTYEFVDRVVTPADALSLLAEHRLPAARRAQLAEIVRATLSTSDTLGAPAGVAVAGVAPAGVAVARLEQREKDAVNALAQLAIEVEELAANGASARALIHTVRAVAKLSGLVPVERAGDATHFDRSRHVSVAGPIADGAEVVVVRPGYIWNRPDKEMLIARAVVQDRSTR